MALGILLILFVVMSAVSVLGIASLVFVKNKEAKKYIFYGLCLWGMIIALLGVTSLPMNYVFQRLAAWGLGFLSAGAIVIHVRDREEKLRPLAYTMAVLSIVLGIVQIFF